MSIAAKNKNILNNMLELKRPLAIFDIESTGLDLAKDRIVEICILKVKPNGEKIKRTFRVNPTIPIPAHVSEIHGIYDEDVKDCPTFKEVANELFQFLKDCDIAGYNSNQFDVPLLNEEFLRLNMTFKDSKRRFIDAYRIFQKNEKRNLEAAYKFYCDKDLENAHNAEADVMATYEVLKGQIAKYGDGIGKNVEEMHEYTNDNNFYDSGRRMILDKGVVKFNFGKHKGRPVEDVLRREPQYYDWIMRSDFLLDTKQKLSTIMLGMKFKIK